MKVYSRSVWTDRPSSRPRIPLPHPNLRLHHSVMVLVGRAKASKAVEIEGCRSLARIAAARGLGEDPSYLVGMAESGRAYQLAGVGRRGTHTCNHNGDFGVVCFGNFEAHKPGRKMLRRLRALARTAVRKGWLPRTAGAYNHRDTGACSGPTACPGQHLAPFIGKIRKTIRNALRLRPTPKPAPPPEPGDPHPPTLLTRDRGAVVKKAQRRLNKHRRVKRPKGARAWPKLKVDGDFGPRTERAVRALQSWHRRRLDVDGIVGPQVWRVLLAKP